MNAMKTSPVVMKRTKSPSQGWEKCSDLITRNYLEVPGARELPFDVLKDIVRVHWHDALEIATRRALRQGCRYEKVKSLTSFALSVEVPKKVEASVQRWIEEHLN